LRFNESKEYPDLDSSRDHLDILRDALEILKKHQPVSEVTRRGCTTGELDCAECGFPLNGNVKPGVKHATYIGRLRYESCKYVRAIAELESWIRVEDKILADKEDE